MPSETYRLIWEAARNRRQVLCAYHDLPREICPVIVGYRADGTERVFAYQFGGKTSGGSKLPQWRCLDLAEVHDVQAREGEWHEGAGHRQTQTCIEWVDVDVNIPETLTHEAPLPFGSPELRRPRRSE